MEAGLEDLAQSRVLVAELMDEEIIARLAAAVQVDVKYGLSHEQLLEIIPDYHGIIVRSETQIDRSLLDAATNLRIVGRAGSGLDNIDVPYATQKGVIVCNTPESNIISAAEHTMGLLLASSRNIPWADRFIKSGKWGRSQFEGSELYAKTLGIIGLGRIGSLVSQRARGFAMRVIAYDPYIPYSRFSNLNVERRETLEELLRESDYVTIHTPRTKETLNMIADKQIAMMKPGVRLVNVARGGLYNEEALYRGLKSGHIASLGVDTWVHEPQESHPLYEFDTVVGTPHLGASTLEASKRVGEEVIAEVIAGLRGQIVKNAVNMPALSRRDLPQAAGLHPARRADGHPLPADPAGERQAGGDGVRRQGDRRPRGRPHPVAGRRSRAYSRASWLPARSISSTPACWPSRRASRCGRRSPSRAATTATSYGSS